MLTDAELAVVRRTIGAEFMSSFVLISRKKPSTDAQRAALALYQIDGAAMDRRQASGWITTLRSRSKQKLATPAQLVGLLKVGVDERNAVNCSRHTASKILRMKAAAR